MCERYIDQLPLNWRLGPQSRHVPWLGIELVTFWFAGCQSIHWATPAGAHKTIWLKLTACTFLRTLTPLGFSPRHTVVFQRKLSSPPFQLSEIQYLGSLCMVPSQVPSDMKLETLVCPLTSRVTFMSWISPCHYMPYQLLMWSCEALFRIIFYASERWTFAPGVITISLLNFSSFLLISFGDLCQLVLIDIHSG